MSKKFKKIPFKFLADAAFDSFVDERHDSDTPEDDPMVCMAFGNIKLRIDDDFHFVDDHYLDEDYGVPGVHYFFGLRKLLKKQVNKITRGNPLNIKGKISLQKTEKSRAKVLIKPQWERGSVIRYSARVRDLRAKKKTFHLGSLCRDGWESFREFQNIPHNTTTFYLEY